MKILPFVIIEFLSMNIRHELMEFLSMNIRHEV